MIQVSLYGENGRIINQVVLSSHTPELNYLFTPPVHGIVTGYNIKYNPDFSEEGFEVQSFKVKWFVETGICDGGGIGHWEQTVESYPCKSENEANALRDRWLDEGKLQKMHWGELRPKFSYGLFRIRKELERIA